MMVYMAQTVKRLPEIQETWVRSLGWEDPLEEEMAAHSSVLTWRIPWTEEPGGLQSMGSQRVGHNWVTNTHTHTHNLQLPWGFSGKESSCLCRRREFDPWVRKIPWRREWQLTPVFLPGESPWTEEPGRLQFMWSQRVRQDWATEQQKIWQWKYPSIFGQGNDEFKMKSIRHCSV